jgi:hypothetical protein
MDHASVTLNKAYLWFPRTNDLIFETVVRCQWRMYEGDAATVIAVLYHLSIRRYTIMDVIVTSVRVDASRECPFCRRMFSRQSAQTL